MNVDGSVGLWFFIGGGVWIGRGFFYGVYSGDGDKVREGVELEVGGKVVSIDL